MLPTALAQRLRCPRSRAMVMTVLDDDVGEQEDVDQRPGSGELVGDLPAVATRDRATGRWRTRTDCGRGVS